MNPWQGPIAARVRAVAEVASSPSLPPHLPLLKAMSLLKLRELREGRAGLGLVKEDNREYKECTKKKTEEP